MAVTYEEIYLLYLPAQMEHHTYVKFYDLHALLIHLYFCNSKMSILPEVLKVYNYSYTVLFEYEIKNAFL